MVRAKMNLPFVTSGEAQELAQASVSKSLEGKRYTHGKARYVAQIQLLIMLLVVRNLFAAVAAGEEGKRHTWYSRVRPEM